MTRALVVPPGAPFRLLVLVARALHFVSGSGTTSRKSHAGRALRAVLRGSNSRSVVLIIATLALAGCGPSFQLQLPERFVTLNDNTGRGAYELRATTPDGVVVGVEVIPNDVQGSTEFWKEALLRRLRDQQGYELLGEQDIRAANGQRGPLMRFGRDLNGHAYRYSVAVFVTPSAIFLIEAGGRQEPYTALEASIERSISAMRF